MLRLVKLVYKVCIKCGRALLGDTPFGFEGMAIKLGFFESSSMVRKKQQLIDAIRRNDFGAAELWEWQYRKKAAWWQHESSIAARSRFEVAACIQMASIYQRAGNTEGANTQLGEAIAVARVYGLHPIVEELSRARVVILQT